MIGSATAKNHRAVGLDGNPFIQIGIGEQLKSAPHCNEAIARIEGGNYLPAHHFDSSLEVVSKVRFHYDFARPSINAPRSIRQIDAAAPVALDKIDVHAERAPFARAGKRVNTMVQVIGKDEKVTNLGPDHET